MEGCGDRVLCVACLDSFDSNRKGKTLCTTNEFGRDYVCVVNAICDVHVEKNTVEGEALYQMDFPRCQKATLTNAKRVHGEACKFVVFFFSPPS